MVKKWLVSALVLGSTALCVSGESAFAQLPPIRVESSEVLVPVHVYDRTLMYLSNPVGRSKWNWNGGEVRNLTAKDFHIFEDGKEQQIRSVAIRQWPMGRVQDNLSQHDEWSYTPKGKWITSDLPSRDFYPAPVASYGYVVAYAPTHAADGSCRRIDVKVDWPNSLVYSRKEYCDVAHSTSDLLKGTKFGQEMERDATALKSGKIPLSVQATVFYEGPDLSRVDIALGFPWDSLKREWRGRTLYASIGVLGMIYRKDGTVAARFSDFACCSEDDPIFIWGDNAFMPWVEDPGIIPASYETRVDLPPGDYDLRVVLSDGSKFGRVSAPLIVESIDRKRLGISSVALCKRFRKISDRPMQDDGTFVDLAPELAQLVSNRLVFTPTGDTRFNRPAHSVKGDPMFAYFEIYEPLLPDTRPANVQTQLKITDKKTGKLAINTGWRSVADWIYPGSTVISVAEQIEINKLPKGSYELSVQTWDSANQMTAWRAASFTVE